MSRTRITLQDLIDRGLSPEGWQVVVDGAGNFGLAAPGVGASGLGVFLTDEGFPLGTGTTLDFVGDGVVVTLSGTVAKVFITGGGGGGVLPPVTGTVVLYDGQSILGSVEKIVVEGDPAYAAITGAFGYVSFSGSVGPAGAEGATGSTGETGAEGATGSAGSQGPAGTGTFGVFVTDEGVPLGTGTILDFTGDGVTATISGSVVDVSISSVPNPPVTGTFVLYDETSILGSVEKIIIEGTAISAAKTGSFGFVRSSAGIGGGTALGIMSWDEGVLLQTGTIMNFVGPGVVASVSGTVIDVTVEAGGADILQTQVFS